VFLQVLLSIGHAVLLLVDGSGLSDPHEDMSSRIEHESVVAVELRDLDITSLRHFGEHHLSSGVGELDEGLVGGGFPVIIVREIGSVCDVSLSSEIVPKLLFLLSLVHDDHLRPSVSLMVHRLDQLSSSVLLEDASVFSVPLEELEACVEDEHVSVVERGDLLLHFSHTDVLLSFQPHQA